MTEPLNKPSSSSLKYSASLCFHLDLVSYMGTFFGLFMGLHNLGDKIVGLSLSEIFPQEYAGKKERMREKVRVYVF